VPFVCECNPSVLTRMDTHPPAHKHTHTHTQHWNMFPHCSFLMCCFVCLCVCVSQVSQTQYSSALQGYDISILEQIKDLVFAQIDELRCEFV